MDTKKTLLQRIFINMVKNGWFGAIYNTAFIGMLANKSYDRPYILVMASIMCIWLNVMQQSIVNYIWKN